MKLKIMAFMMAFALFASILVGGAVSTPQAQAGNCTISVGNLLCGKIYNAGSLPVFIIRDWGGTTGRQLYPGRSSTSYYQDTDGFRLPSNHKALVCVDGYCTWTYGPGNFKVTDHFYTYNIKVYYK